MTKKSVANRFFGFKNRMFRIETRKSSKISPKPLLIKRIPSTNIHYFASNNVILWLIYGFMWLISDPRFLNFEVLFTIFGFWWMISDFWWIKSDC
jgi:hypothetical protein